MRVLKSIYRFLCGDPFILVLTLAAFCLAGLLESVAHAPTILTVAIFLGLVVAGLALALRDERRAGGR